MTNEKRPGIRNSTYNILTDSCYLDITGEPVIDPVEESDIARFTELYHKMQQEEQE